MAAKRNRDADIVKHKMDLRVRFKKLVRAVIMNQTWLSDEEEQGISMNVKKNVALMRQKRKPGMLTLAVSLPYIIIYIIMIKSLKTEFQDKALLRSNPNFRTIEERKKLCMLIAGLNCFSRIPPVRKKIGYIIIVLHQKTLYIELRKFEHAWSRSLSLYPSLNHD